MTDEIYHIINSAEVEVRIEVGMPPPDGATVIDFAGAVPESGLVTISAKMLQIGRRQLEEQGIPLEQCHEITIRRTVTDGRLVVLSGWLQPPLAESLELAEPPELVSDGPDARGDESAAGWETDRSGKRVA